MVYATDAAAEPSVKIVATFFGDTHPPMTYPFVITAVSHNESAAQFLDFRKSPAAREIFKAQGFGVIPP
ncbi:MAG: substrate-binding domain-containing protein [Roseiarcus sp.]